MNAATLVVVFLLVTAASLASYLLSQWSSTRNSHAGIGWVAISIGITLLLATAAIVVLTVDLLPVLRLSPNIEPVEPMRQSTQFGRETAERMADRREAATHGLGTRSRAAAPTDRAGRYIAEGASEPSSGLETATLRPSGAARDAQDDVGSHGVGLVFTEADRWAATHCVLAFNPDPADPTRWRIENECGAPVGVLFASCAKSPPECSGESIFWEYQIDGMILPGKVQRPVTDADETQYGSQIRYVACMVAGRHTIELIGQPIESRSSPSWLEQLDAARNRDECLAHVRKWSEMGRESGKSIDILLGGSAPGKVHPDPASEP